MWQICQESSDNFSEASKVNQLKLPKLMVQRYAPTLILLDHILKLAVGKKLLPDILEYQIFITKERSVYK